ncbi:MAG: VOC family protein [Gracilimonas sp.]|uniref:VOC family protein n=1 Tax=Gracilimonas sp. TaxID=1974203 RepID=UPI0019C9FE3E|nr:VOC family protein [Gracilimonas sp.]MBD3617577.1 VOC family protein [Gracilimonas sp.]
MTHHKGIHHITALAGDAQRNAEFYTQILGMRLVKKSVNQDDPGTYHLFYGNQSGEPGSSLTFFPWPNAVKGEAGVGEVVNVGLQVPESSKDYWEVRLSENDIQYEVTEVFGRKALRFKDPDGLELDIVFEGEAKPKVENVNYIVPAEHTIQGFWGARMLLTEKQHTGMLLGDLFDFEEAAAEGNQTLYQTEAPIGRNIIIEISDKPEYGKNGRGIVHHIAYRAENEEELEQLRQKVGKKGLQPTQIIDRHWFNSVYYRIPAGVLFEMASDDPGYTVDEEFEELGEHLILPPWLESKRDQIEQILPEIKVATKA